MKELGIKWRRALFHQNYLRGFDLSMQDTDTDKASLKIRAGCDAFRKKVLEAVKRR